MFCIYTNGNEYKNKIVTLGYSSTFFFFDENMRELHSNSK